MPEIVGRLRPPRLAGAPTSPVRGEMYYDTGTDKLYWWNGTIWVDSTGGGSGGGVTEVFTGPGTPPGSQVLWIDTDEPSGGATAQKTLRTGYTWAVAGALAAAQIIPPFYIPMASGQATTIVGFRAKVSAATSIVAQVTRNGSSIGSSATITTTKTTTSFSAVSIADGDEIGLTLSSPSGSPANLSMTVIAEHIF